MALFKGSTLFPHRETFLLSCSFLPPQPSLHIGIQKQGASSELISVGLLFQLWFDGPLMSKGVKTMDMSEVSCTVMSWFTLYLRTFGREE